MKKRTKLYWLLKNKGKNRNYLINYCEKNNLKLLSR